MLDMVNHPPHYADGTVKCIEIMELVFGFEATAQWALQTAFKYVWRMGQKGSKHEDAKKALWYLTYYAETMECHTESNQNAALYDVLWEKANAAAEE